MEYCSNEMTQADEYSSNVVKTVRRSEGVVIFELAGDIDLHSSVELRACLLEVLEQQPSTVLINMDRVDFMDSSGLATLVEIIQRSRRYGGLLKLNGVQPRVRSILEISCLDRIFQVYDSEAEALA